MKPRTMSTGQVTRWVIGGAVLLFVLWSTIKIVGVGQVGIVTRLGSVDRELDSGLHLKFPWPLEKLHTFDIKTQKDEADADASSQDLQDVKVTIVTNYRIDHKQVGDLYSTVGTSYKERIIDPAIQESVKATTSKYPVADLIVKRGSLKNDVVKSLRDRLGKRGIVVEDISITNIGFSSAFTDAIEQKQVAEQNAQKAQFDLKAAQINAQAQEAQKQSLTAEILQQQAITKWDGKLPTYLGQGSVFNIPLSR